MDKRNRFVTRVYQRSGQNTEAHSAKKGQHLLAFLGMAVM
jgi:hypothetical protein